MMTDHEARVVLPDARHRFSPRPGWEMALLLGAEDTGGAFGLVTMTVAAGGQPTPLHSHSAAETFSVLAGACTLQIGGRTVEAPAGAVVHVPGGVVHGIWNAGDHAARVLLIVTPGGMERYFEEAAALVRATPPGELPARLERLRTTYGIRDVL